MQERELTNLIQGEPAKWATISESVSASQLTRQFMEQNEVPVPKPVVKAVDIWVDRCRKLGMSEKNIRKSVRKRFNIKLVK